MIIPYLVKKIKSIHKLFFDPRYIKKIILFALPRFAEERKQNVIFPLKNIECGKYN